MMYGPRAQKKGPAPNPLSRRDVNPHGRQHVPHVENGMTRNPSILMLVTFLVLVVALVVASAVMRARPRTAREWTLVWALFVFLAWALVGFGWLRSG